MYTPGVLWLATGLLASILLYSEASARQDQSGPLHLRTHAQQRRAASDVLSKVARQIRPVFSTTDDLSKHVYEDADADAKQEEEERRLTGIEDNWFDTGDEAGVDGISHLPVKLVSPEENDLNDIGDSETEDFGDAHDNLWSEAGSYDSGSSDLAELYEREAQQDSTSISRFQAITKRGTSSVQKSLVGYVDKICGASGATTSITQSSGPNGAQSWLNFGISKTKKFSKWNPPGIKLSQLKTVSLATALKSSKSPFHACKPYLKYFNAAGKKYNLPPILLASIAMQESSCNPNASGDNGGAFGLMQLVRKMRHSILCGTDVATKQIHENCKGRSGAACAEPAFNIDTAAALFADILKNAGGNVLVALGSYNGWYRGMSFKDATNAAYGSCCVCQQNLDYLQQMLNGWFLNVSPYSKRLGNIRNLDVCSGYKG